MSSGYWQTKRQKEQFKPGNTITQRVKEYIQTWRSRCYSDDIPDEVPDALAKSGRAPSYKAIAMAILRNDHNFYALGFQQRDSQILSAILADKKTQESKQPDMFGGAA